MRDGVRYQFYETADGHILFLASEREFWENFCHGIGRADLFEKHPGSKYADHAVGNIELRPELRGHLPVAARRAEWVELGERVNTPIVTVNTPKTLADDPQFQDRLPWLPSERLGAEQLPTPIKLVDETLPVPTQGADRRPAHRRGAARRARLRRPEDCRIEVDGGVGLSVLLTDEQQALDDAVGRLLAKTSTPEQVRAAEDAGFDPAVWAGLVDMGLIDAAASGEATLADLAVVARQCGAHLATVPFIETVAPEPDERQLALRASWFAGLARAALDLGVQYAKDRHQFGVPIGCFQTIQHRLADLHTAVDGARLLALEAAWASTTGDPDVPAAGGHGLAWCGEQSREAAAA